MCQIMCGIFIVMFILLYMCIYNIIYNTYIIKEREQHPWHTYRECSDALKFKLRATQNN